MTVIDETTTTTTLHVTEWIGGWIAEHGHHARSPYVERFWLPVLGPTATLLLRRLVLEIEANDGRADVDLCETASAMGLSFRPGRSGPFARALQRLVMFGVAAPTPNGLAVRCFVPDVAPRHRARWSAALQNEHYDVIGDER